MSDQDDDCTTGPQSPMMDNLASIEFTFSCGCVAEIPVEGAPPQDVGLLFRELARRAERSDSLWSDAETDGEGGASHELNRNPIHLSHEGLDHVSLISELVAWEMYDIMIKPLGKGATSGDLVRLALSRANTICEQGGAAMVVESHYIDWDEMREP